MFSQPWLGTNMSLGDWLLIIGSVVFIRIVSVSTRKYMRGVADFLAANRSAGRYLITIAGQMGGMGAITFVAAFQVHFSSGFPPLWWAFISIPCNIIIATLTCGSI
jgi:solute:Na+ symporter, SSS family